MRRSLHHTRHTYIVPVRTMDKYLNCANRSQVHSEGTVWYHGKVFIDPKVAVHRWKNSRLEFAPIHPSLSDNGHPHSLEFTWSISDIYSPFFFHFWIMSTLGFFRTKSLLTRLEPDWPRLTRHLDYRFHHNDKPQVKSNGDIKLKSQNSGFLNCVGIFPIVTAQQFYVAGSRLLVHSDRAATGLIYIMVEHPALWYTINPTRFPQRGPHVCQEASITM